MPKPREPHSARPRDIPGQESEPTALQQRFRAAVAALPVRIRRARQPWIVGFSHGADSTALLSLLVECRSELDLPPVHAVCVDHGLRPESARDAEAARVFAKELGLASEVVRVKPRRASEGAAREARYQAFRELGRRMSASAVLLAQQHDDQMETLLLRLMRGSGPLGLCGIPRLRALDQRQADGPQLWRPLLTEAPAGLRALLVLRGQTWIEDASNHDPTYTPRNRVRATLLPNLRKRDPGDHMLRALRNEALALRDAVLAEAAAFKTTRLDAEQLLLPLAPETSPWTREVLVLGALRALGMRQPRRSLAGRLAALLLAGVRTGTKVESRGQWSAVREREHVRLRRD